MVSLSRKTLRAARVALQRSPILRTGKRRIIIPWNEKSSIAQFAPEGLLSDLRTGCSTSTGQAAPRHWNNRPDAAQTAPKVDGKRERFEKNQCIGITRGGRNTKIHAMVDALGNPIHVQLSSGDITDENIADDVLDHVDLNDTIVQADKAYGSYRLREYIANRNADFCIPPKSNTVDPWFCDYFQYKERHLVECFFNKLKENRRIATRFDKLASRFLTFVHLGCIRILLA